MMNNQMESDSKKQKSDSIELTASFLSTHYNVIVRD